jgi:tRNA threonylcarbamoyladenosine biosynthesis protein TsaE
MHEAVAYQSQSFAIDQVEQVASKLLKTAQDLRIWLFYGDLGAGKTTLIKAICKQLDVPESVLSSPTFSIINEYRGKDSLVYHFDFYRMRNEAEILDLGIEEYFESNAYCFVEWPERLGSLMPDHYFKVSITHSGNDSRTIEFERHA